MRESASGFTIRVINPFLLYQTKGINLATIPQRGVQGEARRQDAKQFTVMGIIISELLREFATTIGDERALVKSAGRLLEFALTREGTALVKGGAMDPFKLLPLDLMEVHAEASVRNLASKRLPHFRRQLDSALEKVPVAQADKIRGDLEAMQAELGDQRREARFSDEVERGRRRPSSLERGRRTVDPENGPDLGR